MLTEERLSEIRALTWEWQYENCSDHQAAVDDLLRERDALAAEVERLREALVAADRLLAEIGVRRAEPQTWEEMVMAVERRGAAA